MALFVSFTCIHGEDGYLSGGRFIEEFDRCDVIAAKLSDLEVIGSNEAGHLVSSSKEDCFQKFQSWWSLSLVWLPLEFGRLKKERIWTDLSSGFSLAGLLILITSFFSVF